MIHCWICRCSGLLALCKETEMGEVLGEAVVYRLGSNEFDENETKRRYETNDFPILDDHPEFQ